MAYYQDRSGSQSVAVCCSLQACSSNYITGFTRGVTEGYIVCDLFAL